MSVFSKNLTCFLEDRDMRQRELARAVNVTPATVSNWINKGYVPSIEVISDICEKYGISYDDLMSDEYGYYSKTHHLTEAPGGALAARVPVPAYAPLYGRVHAGDAGEPDVLEFSVPIPHEVLDHHKHGYFLEVEGDCMSRVYPPGSMVFIDPDLPPQSGSIAVVDLGAEGYIMRRLYIGASVLVLSPESYNDEWEDIIVNGDMEARLVGTVVWYQAPEEMD